MLTTSGLTMNGVPALPIWRDIIYSTEDTGFSALSDVDFSIKIGNAVLATGRAAKRPGDTYVQIRLNDIVAGYLRQTAKNAETVTYYTYVTGPQVEVTGKVFHGTAETFDIVVSDPAGVIASETEGFVAFDDWSHDYNEDLTFPAVLNPSSMENYPPAFRNVPICVDANGILADMRQYLLFSAIKATSLWVGGLQKALDGGGAAGAIVFYCSNAYADMPMMVALKAGDLPDASEPWNVPEDQRRRYEVDFEYEEDNVKYYLYASYFEKPSLYYRKSFAFAVRNTCARYCLYYQNAIGGWDWFLILGKSVVSDNITRDTMVRRGSTDLLMDRIERRGKDVITLDMVKHLELHTHWLSDDEASRMFHLTESPDVYVHDLETGIIHPAVLTGSSHTEKTYKGQGNKLVSYVIELDYAVERKRR